MHARWIGQEGAAFERVGMAFQALGYQAPRPDAAGGIGAYGMNIVAQYQADLSQEDAMAIIRYGLEHSRETLQAHVHAAGTRDALRLSDVRLSATAAR